MSVPFFAAVFTMHSQHAAGKPLTCIYTLQKAFALLTGVTDLVELVAFTITAPVDSKHINFCLSSNHKNTGCVPLPPVSHHQSI